MIRCCLISEWWPMRPEWLRSNLPDSLARGARAVCGYKLTSCNATLTDRLRIRRFVAKKWMHDIPCLTAFVAFPPFSMLDKCPFSYSRKRVDGEVKMKEMFLLLSPSSLSVGLQSSPFLYILTIFLQMKAHDVLHKTWKVAAPVAQSAHDEVRPFLCLPAQIDRLSAINLVGTR